jgi:hypothetical protein
LRLRDGGAERGHGAGVRLRASSGGLCLRVCAAPGECRDGGASGGLCLRLHLRGSGSSRSNGHGLRLHKRLRLHDAPGGYGLRLHKCLRLHQYVRAGGPGCPSERRAKSAVACGLWKTWFMIAGYSLDAGNWI